MKKWPKKGHFLQKNFIEKWQNLYKKNFLRFFKNPYFMRFKWDTRLSF